MKKDSKRLDSYTRDILAPLIFPAGFTENGNELTGNCPKCGKGGGHCSITLLDNTLVGHCYKCGWTVKEFRKEHPEYDENFEGHSRILKDNEDGALRDPEREHTYTNAIGKVLYKKQIFRNGNGKKDAVWLTLQGDGCTWHYNIPQGKHAPIYRLHEISAVAEKAPDEWIAITEGEKDADSLVSMKIPATSFPNGCGSVKRGKKLTYPDWLSPFEGRRVVVFGDNDTEGAEYVEALKEKLLPVALALKVIMPTDLLDMPFNQVAAKKKGYDVTDFIEEVGKEAAYQKIKSLIDSLPVVSAEKVDKGLPKWVCETTNGKIRVDEIAFCEEIKQEKDYRCINDVFFSHGKKLVDAAVKSEIQNKVAPFFTEKTGVLTDNVYKTLKNYCYTSPMIPADGHIYCAENMSITFSSKGELLAYPEDVYSLVRLPVKYKPEAKCPTFEKLVSDLFYPEDIPVIQEFVGYCLVPNTRAQKGLFIVGKGGEGKSTFAGAIMPLFGETGVKDRLSGLAGKFSMADLENKLLLLDDDIETSLLQDTSFFKKIITAQGEQRVEEKYKAKRNIVIFTHLICIGNSFLGSMFDHSDGFYRRQLLVECKAKSRTESEDSSNILSMCEEETAGIFNWALTGLSRLIGRGYHFELSPRMARLAESHRLLDDNIRAFLSDTSVIQCRKDYPDIQDAISSEVFFLAYALWCRDNGETPVKRISFQRRIASDYGEQRQRVWDGSKKLQGYIGFRVNPEMLSRIRADKNGYDAESNWLNRLP